VLQLFGALALFAVMVVVLVVRHVRAQKAAYRALGSQPIPPRAAGGGAERPPSTPATEERLVVNPDWPFERLARSLEGIGFALDGAASPTSASFRNTRGSVIAWVGDPATGFSALALRSPNARYLVNDVVNGAYVSTAETKIQDWLRSSDLRMLRLGVRAADWLGVSAKDGKFYVQPLEELARWGPPEIAREAGEVLDRVARVVGAGRAPTAASRALAFQSTGDAAMPLAAKDGPVGYRIRVGTAPGEPPFTLITDEGRIALRLAEWPKSWSRSDAPAASALPKTDLPERCDGLRYAYEGGAEHAPDSPEGWSRIELDAGSGALVVENRRGGSKRIFRARVDRVALDRLHEALRAASFPYSTLAPGLPRAIVPGTTHDTFRVFDGARVMELTLPHHDRAARPYAPVLATWSSLLTQVSGGRLGYGRNELPPCVHDIRVE
jgi:hypothetical protein